MRESPLRNGHRSRAAALLALALLSGCNLTPDLNFAPPIVCRTPTDVVSSIYLIGDAGEPKLPEPTEQDRLVDPVLSHLRAAVDESVAVVGPDRTLVVFLGDNVYPAGLPPKDREGRERAERILDAQIAAAGRARAIFVLGNHDWNQAKEDGYERALEQYEYLSTRAPNVEIRPPNACPGPDAIDFGDDLRLVFGDLWSAIYHEKFPDAGLHEACDFPYEATGLPARYRFRDEMRSTSRRSILLIHAPLITSGPHGGYFPWREHIFPLRVFHRDLWIPLPIIGSIFPLARLMGVTDTDLTSRNYRNYHEAMDDIFEPNRPLLVASGHEHSLQIHVDPLGTFHAVSGAGSTRKVDYVRTLRSELMAIAAPGYMRMDEYQDGTLHLTVIAPSKASRPDGLIFHTCIL